MHLAAMTMQQRSALSSNLLIRGWLCLWPGEVSAGEGRTTAQGLQSQVDNRKADAACHTRYRCSGQAQPGCLACAHPRVVVPLVDS